MFIQELLSVMIEKKASDLHIKTGRPPMLRIHGELVRIDMPSLDPAIGSSVPARSRPK